MTFVQWKKTHRMSFLLLVNNLLSQNCYTFTDYLRLCLSKTKGDFLPLCPRRQIHPSISQSNQYRGRSFHCRHLLRHWWKNKMLSKYIKTLPVWTSHTKLQDWLCSLGQTKTAKHFIGMRFWYSCANPPPPLVTKKYFFTFHPPSPCHEKYFFSLPQGREAV